MKKTKLTSAKPNSVNPLILQILIQTIIINYTFLNKSKVLQKFSTSLQNRRHFALKNNAV